MSADTYYITAGEVPALTVRRIRQARESLRRIVLDAEVPLSVRTASEAAMDEIDPLLTSLRQAAP